MLNNCTIATTDSVVSRIDLAGATIASVSDRASCVSDMTTSNFVGELSTVTCAQPNSFYYTGTPIDLLDVYNIHMGGHFTKAKNYVAVPEIKEVIFHDGTHTTILWEDGTATDVACGEGEQYNEYEGFCAAIVKKMFDGTGKAKRVMHEKNLTLQREIEKQKAEELRKEEEEKLERKKARAKRRYIKKMAKKMLLEEEIRKAAENMAKEMK